MIKFNPIPADLSKDWQVLKVGDWYAHLGYDVTLAKEPVIQTIDEHNWVTVNRYGSRVLNSRNLFMADFDYDCVFGQDPLNVWKEKLKLIEEIAATHNFRFEIYQTQGGYRILETSQPHIVGFSEWVKTPWTNATNLLSMLSNDPCYVKLCKKQNMFRHRLDPKPWREDEEVVCSSLTVIGTTQRHPLLEPLLEAYDAVLFDADKL